MKKSNVFRLPVLAAIMMAGIECMPNNISGRVMRADDREPAEFCGVGIFSTDTVFINGAATGADGRFEFRDIRPGDYLIGTQYLGYQSMYVAIRGVAGDTDLGDIFIDPVSTELDEVEVRATPVVRTPVKDIIFPSSAQISASPNALALMANLQIANVVVNPATREVSTTSGDRIELRINGIKASQEEIAVLSAQEIQRVEWYDGPTLRYEGAMAVMNFIVAKKTSGGNIAADFTQAVSIAGLGEYSVAGNMHKGPSSFGFNMYVAQRKMDFDRTRTERYILPDATIETEEESRKVPLHEYTIQPILSYNYNTQGRMFNAILKYTYNARPNATTDRNGLFYENGNGYSLYDNLDASMQLPSLDLYYEQSFAHTQTIYIDLTGTVIPYHSRRTFSMTGIDDGTAGNGFIQNVDGRKYSAIGEMIYEKKWDAAVLTAGVRYTNAYTRYDYSGVNAANAGVRLHSQEEYAFVQGSFPLRSLRLSAGMGVLHISEHQGGIRNSDWIPRPQLDLSLPLGNVNLKYGAYMSGYAPDIDQLSAVQVPVDAYQQVRGNPDLESSVYFSNELNVGWRPFPFLNCELLARYSYDHKPIMPEMIIESGSLINTYDNQKSFHRLLVQPSFQIFPLKTYMQVTVTPYFTRYISNGNSYVHTCSNFGVRARIMGQWRNWFAMADLCTKEDVLWGETLTMNEYANSVTIGYSKGPWSLRATMIGLFDNPWEVRQQNISAIAPSCMNAKFRNLQPIFAIGGSLNLDFGSRKAKAEKRINNSDEDAGAVSGAK